MFGRNTNKRLEELKEARIQAEIDKINEEKLKVIAERKAIEANVLAVEDHKETSPLQDAKLERLHEEILKLKMERKEIQQRLRLPGYKWIPYYRVLGTIALAVTVLGVLISTLFSTYTQVIKPNAMAAADKKARENQALSFELEDRRKEVLRLEASLKKAQVQDSAEYLRQIASLQKIIKELESTPSLPADARQRISSLSFQKIGPRDLTFVDGKFVALLIANQDYSEPVYDLQFPVSDIQKLGKILENEYGFEVHYAFNQSRTDILKTLKEVATSLKDEDNFVLAYSGHGGMDEFGEGYWMGVDKVPSEHDFVKNTEVSKILSQANPQHTLLISDACFSGSLLLRGVQLMHRQANALEVVYNMKSRRAMTSAGKQNTLDNSVFMQILCEELLNNESGFVLASDLFFAVRAKMFEAHEKGNDLISVPQYGAMPGTGDEGGEFIFLKKDLRITRR